MGAVTEKMGRSAPVSRTFDFGLIWQLARRDVEARYRGSVLGILWAVAVPLAMLCVYLFVFTTVLRARWETPTGTQADVALFLFSGLLIFNIFGETVARAPGLIAEAPHYVKKVVFPLEVLPVVTLLSALLPFFVSATILFVSMLVTGLGVPWTVIFLPVLVLPLGLLTLGLSWFLSAIAVYLPDVRHVIGLVVTMALFLSPIFYPASAIPEGLRWIYEFSPIAWVVETSKDVLFWQRPVDWTSYGVMTGACTLVALLGLWFFMSAKRGFADVI